MSKAADEYEDIARRLKELEADRQLALTGSTVPEPKVGEYAIGWPYGEAASNSFYNQWSAMANANYANQYKPFNAGYGGLNNGKNTTI